MSNSQTDPQERGGTTGEFVEQIRHRLELADRWSRRGSEPWLDQYRHDVRLLVTQLAERDALLAEIDEVGTLEHARRHIGCGTIITAKDAEIEAMRGVIRGLLDCASERIWPSTARITQALAALDQAQPPVGRQQDQPPPDPLG